MLFKLYGIFPSSTKEVALYVLGYFLKDPIAY